MSLLVGLISLIAFFTTIPMPKSKVSLEQGATFMCLSPIVGILVGFLFGISTYLFKLILPRLIASFFGLAILLLITGLHHIDGLIDFGDALMFRGSKEKKIEVMRDVKVGVGGIVLGFFVLVLTGLSLTYIKTHLIIQTLIVSEMSAKNALVTLASFANPAKDGIGKIFIEKVRERRFLSILVALAISVIIAYLLLNLIGLLAILVGLVCSITILCIARLQFGVVTGDVFGALNEISRLVILLVLLWCLV